MVGAIGHGDQLRPAPTVILNHTCHARSFGGTDLCLAIPLIRYSCRLESRGTHITNQANLRLSSPIYRSKQSTSSLDEFAPRLTAWLSAEAVKSRKQRRTLKQMFLGLRGGWDMKGRMTAWQPRETMEGGPNGEGKICKQINMQIIYLLFS